MVKTSNQGRSQNTADARAQHRHTTFASSLISRPRPAFCHLQVICSLNDLWKKQLGGLGNAPPENFGILEFLGQFWGYFRQYCPLELEHCDQAFTTNLRTCSTRGKHAYIEIRGAYDTLLFWGYRAIWHSSISTPLCTFRARFATG